MTNEYVYIMSTIENQIAKLIHNALDFLKVAAEEIGTKPKYSYIHFWAGIELLIKARVAREHWTLIISSKETPKMDDFLSNKSHSKNFNDLCDILKNTIKSPIAKGHLDRLDKIRKHRNKWIHFYQDSDDEQIRKDLILDHLHGWYVLNFYLGDVWSKHFKTYEKEIHSIYSIIKKNDSNYFNIAYEYIKTDLKKVAKDKTNNQRLEKCSACGYKACLIPTYHSGMIFNSACELCGFEAKYLYIDCEHCEETNCFNEVKDNKCSACDHEYQWKSLISKVTVNGLGNSLDIHCYCGSRNLIEYNDEYFCVECKKHFQEDDLHECEGCFELGPEDMTFGCYFCKNYEPDY